MGTRAIYRFTDNEGTYAVYKHYDGYPTGAAEFLLKAFGKAWKLPRYEANELAASFVAANKEDEGGVRLMNDPDADWGQDYVYDVFQAKNGQMIVKVYNGVVSDNSIYFYGRLKDFCLQEMNVDKETEIVNTFHGEPTAKFNGDDANVELKKAEIMTAVKDALDKINKIKSDLEEVVKVGY